MYKIKKMVQKILLDGSSLKKFKVLKLQSSNILYQNFKYFQDFEGKLYNIIIYT